MPFVFDLLFTKKRFTPDYMFERFCEVTPAFLQSAGISHLLIDIDNTLAPYEEPDASEEICAWFTSLREAGITCALVSNNHKERVERFNERLGLPCMWDSKKPSARIPRKMMTLIGGDVSNTAVLGDQLLTDCYTGKRMGVKAIILPPIKDKTNLFFRSKRVLERKYIRAFIKKNGYRPYFAFWKVKDASQGDVAQKTQKNA